MSRRMLTVALATALFWSLSVAVAAADELEDYLADSAEATFAGQRATWSSFGGRTEFSIVSVEQAASMMMVESAGTSQVLGGGRSSANGSGLALSDWSSVGLADRYVTVSTEPTTRLGRQVVVVTVNESDRMRARVWFDQDTGAALGSEVYDGSEALFRLSWMLDFNPNPRRIFTVMGDSDSTYDLVVVSEAETLPATLAEYTKVDTYAGPSDSLHAFYSDGLFSFSVFVITGEGVTGPFVDAETWEIGSGSYRWILTSTDLWLQWSGNGRTYVLVGDLPPDHLEQVLSELPNPSRGNIFSRFWNGIFG